MRRTAPVLGALVLVLGTIGCFSSPAPPQLPQPPPVIVYHNVPVRVPQAVRDIATELKARQDNTTQGILIGRAAVAFDVLSEVSDCVTTAPTVVFSTTAVAPSTTPDKPRLRDQFNFTTIACFAVGVFCAVAGGVAIYLARKGLPFAGTAGGALFIAAAGCFVAAFAFWQAEAVLWTVGIIAGLILLAAGANWLVQYYRTKPSPPPDTG